MPLPTAPAISGTGESFVQVLQEQCLAALAPGWANLRLTRHGGPAVSALLSGMIVRCMAGTARVGMTLRRNGRLRGSGSGTASGPPSASKIRQLRDMGFTEEEARAALAAVDGRVDAAIQYLVQQANQGEGEAQRVREQRSAFAASVDRALGEGELERRLQHVRETYNPRAEELAAQASSRGRIVTLSLFLIHARSHARLRLWGGCVACARRHSGDVGRARIVLCRASGWRRRSSNRARRSS